jgi:uncharacterized membrane protein YsdA (DUF1294 family)
MKQHRLVLWVSGSAVLMLLAFGGLCASGLMRHEVAQSEFVVCLLFLVLLWISFVAFLVSVLCWTASKVFR